MARYCGTLPKKKLAYGGQAPDPFGGNPQGNALYDPQGAKNQTIDNIGTGVASYFGPWWGALAKAGTMTSGIVKGDETNSTRSQAGQLTDPFNQFKNNKNGADWLLSFGNPFRSALTKGKQRVKDIQTAKTAQVTAKNKAFGPAAAAGMNQMFTGDQGPPQFAAGGSMDGKPTVTSGGKFKRVAGDVVQVQASTAGKDTVKTPVADLDNGEIIDGQNKVYSNRIAHPAGGTIATKAKAAALQGQPLAPLYNLQEAMKTESIPGKRLTVKKGSSAASARPSVNGQTITADELNRIQDQSNAVKIPFRTREKIVPVKDRVNPLRKPKLATGGNLDPEKIPATGQDGALQGGGMPTTRMGLTVKRKAPSTLPVMGNTVTQRPVKIKNFSRSGYR